MSNSQTKPTTQMARILGLMQTIFSSFSKSKKQEKMQEKKVVLTQCSQSHVLQQRMKEERLTHGERVTADISPVRLEQDCSGKMVMYFCPMQDIAIHERIAKGDGGSLPPEAIINGLSVPGEMHPGLFTLKNVELFSNGTLQVNVTEHTKFVDYESCRSVADREREERYRQQLERETQFDCGPVIYEEIGPRRRF